MHPASGRVGGLPIVRGDRDRAADAGTASETFFVARALRGENLALLVTHRAEVVETLEDLNAAEATQSNAVTGLTEPESGLEDGIQQVGFVDHPHLATRWLAANR